MSDKIRLRNFSRVGLALGSVCFMGGGVLMYVGVTNIGDAIMIFGGVAMLASALLLATTPTGDKDAG